MKTVKAVVFLTLIAFGVLGLWQTASAAEVAQPPDFNPEPPEVEPPVISLPTLVPHVYRSCHPRLIQHWDKIIFQLHRASSSGVLDPETDNIAKDLRIRPHSWLDIKVLDNPRTVADLAEKVAIFLLRRNPAAVTGATLREKVEKLIPHIEIKDVDYAIVCARTFYLKPNLPLQ